MIATYPNRAAIQAQYPDLDRVLLELVKAINTPPLYIGEVAIHSGTGTPEGVVIGNVGDLFLRTDGSTSTTLYVKTSTRNSKTGWTAK